MFQGPSVHGGGGDVTFIQTASEGGNLNMETIYSTTTNHTAVSKV